MLSACTGADPNPPAATDVDGCPVIGYRGMRALTALSAGTFEAVATFADQVSSFTVVGERFGPPEGDRVEPWEPRRVTVRIDDTAWAGVRTSDPASAAHVRTGDEVEMATWQHDRVDDCIDPTGNPTLLVGRCYVGAMSWSSGEWSLFPGATGVLDDDQRSALRGRLLDGLAGPDAYGARLAAVAMPPAHRDLMLLDPADRFEALLTKSASEPGSPTVP